MTTIRDLPLELHDHIKSYLPWRDQLTLKYLSRRIQFGSRLVEGRKQVKEAFIKAAKKGANVKIVEQLLKHPDLDPSVDYNLAIRWEPCNGEVDVVKLLIFDPRVDPSANDNLAITLASRHGHYDVVKVLLCDPRVTRNIR